MSDIKARAGRIKQLRSDEVFNLVINEIKERQASVFLDPHSEVGDRESAHSIIRALSEIEAYFNSVLSEEAVYDKQNGDKETVPWRTRLRLK